MNYEEAGMILLKESGVVIRKWRTSISGRAYPDGSIVAPRPKTAKSFEVFAHEVGHQVANGDWKKEPSWLSELKAIEYSEQQFIRFGLKLPREIKNKMLKYGAYSICQALNRGMKQIPEEGQKYRAHIKMIGEKAILHGNKTITYKKVWRAI